LRMALRDAHASLEVAQLPATLRVA
jgi:hypothetical protein